MHNLQMLAPIWSDVSSEDRTYLHLLADLNQFGHLVLQLTVSLHKVGQVVLQCLLSGGRRQEQTDSEHFKLEACWWTRVSMNVETHFMIKQIVCIHLTYSLICVMQLFIFITEILLITPGNGRLKGYFITQWDWNVTWHLFSIDWLAHA